jgi:light-regulated signal transduction histidine kinase (bacteriophytochrome)
MSGNVESIIISGRDITDIKLKETIAKKTANELAVSKQELEQFAYIVSHDLQEPLRMVNSYLQLITRRYEKQLDEEGREFINYAVDGAKRMQQLIGDLVRYSRVSTQGKELHPVSSEAVLKKTLSNIEAMIDEFHVEITHNNLPQVWADETQLVQLFQYLLDNAVKFRRDIPPQIHIEAIRKEDFWEFIIQDNGIGIKAEYYERIFMVFQRLHTREEYPGTGIGLPLCKKIVERHGGKIRVESEPGIGSTFYFTLKAVQEIEPGAMEDMG